jgi:hypothetical protein
VVRDGDRGEDNHKSEEENPFLEYSTTIQPVGSVKGKEGDELTGSKRHHIRIISRRVRLCDADNLVGGVKHLVDALRLCQVIPEDDPQSITLEVSQEKVSSYDKEETWVEIIR